MYTKLVRYQLRKINADRRPRVKGRFIKKEEQEKVGAAAATGSEGSGREGSGSPAGQESTLSDDDEGGESNS